MTDVDVLRAAREYAESHRSDIEHDINDFGSLKPLLELPAILTSNPLQHELLDLITLMPDSQTQEIIDYITSLREISSASMIPAPLLILLLPVFGLVSILGSLRRWWQR